MKCSYVGTYILFSTTDTDPSNPPTTQRPPSASLQSLLSNANRAGIFCKYYDLKIKSREIAAGELYYK
jgi:hypothetical protein